MDEQTIKHLEIIQSVVERLARNSFIYKGWSITTVAAIIALAAPGCSKHFMLIALLPSFTFWGLDAFYLKQERLYRRLYDDARSKGTLNLRSGAFSMDIAPYETDEQTWLRICWSKTIAFLYLPLVLIVIAAVVISYLLD